MSTFSGISSALSALQAQRKAMDVIGQNIANANTPGYTRQRVDLAPVVSTGTPTLYTGSRSVGDGVAVVGTTRSSDALLQARVDTQTADHAMLSGRADTLSALEGMTHEPGTNGLSERLSAMWSSWSDVANHPTSDASRAVVVESTQGVVDALHTASAGVSQLWQQSLDGARTRVAEVNATAASVADMNARIQKATVTGGTVNELMDQRDQLVTRLSELTGSTAQAGPNGQVDVLLGGSALVQGGRALALQVTPAGASLAGAKGAPPTTVSVSYTDGASGSIASGQLAADLTALNTTLPDASKGYDAIAASLASRVNAVQQRPGAQDGTGSTSPGPVFAGDLHGAVTAESIRLVVTSGSQLAAGLSTNGSADGSNAAAVAALGTAVGGPDALWKTQVSSLAAASSAAAARSTSAQSVLTASVTDQQGQSGVSLDEEAAALIAAQRAYQGAARVLTALDEALNTLINSTGLVGR